STSMFHSSKIKLVILIIKYWEKHVNIHAVVSCALLSFDTSALTMFDEKIKAAHLWFRKFAADYAFSWGISKSDDMPLIVNEVTQEWSSFIGRSPGSCFDQMDDDIAQL